MDLRWNRYTVLRFIYLLKKHSLELGNLKKYIMAYTLNFPNGNVQTYSSYGELRRAAQAMGGEVKEISTYVYAFVPKKK